MSTVGAPQHDVVVDIRAKMTWQGAKEAKAQAEAAAAASAAEVAGIRQQCDSAAADLDRLSAQRELALQEWEEERHQIDADRAALLSSMEVPAPATIFSWRRKRPYTFAGSPLAARLFLLCRSREKGLPLALTSRQHWLCKPQHCRYHPCSPNLHWSSPLILTEGVKWFKGAKGSKF